MRLYASTVNDSQLRAALRKANRQQILLAQANHGELVRRGGRLGHRPVEIAAAFTRSRRPGSRPGSTDRRRACRHSCARWLTSSTGSARRWKPSSAREARRRLQVALRQPIPDHVDCGNCNREKAGLDNARRPLTVALRRGARLPAVSRSVRRCHRGVPRVLRSVWSFAWRFWRSARSTTIREEGMNPTVLVIALVIVGAVAGKLLMRRFPTVSRQQIFCAIAAWVAGLSWSLRQYERPVLVLRWVVRRSDHGNLPDPGVAAVVGTRRAATWPLPSSSRDPSRQTWVPPRNGPAIPKPSS